MISNSLVLIRNCQPPQASNARILYTGYGHEYIGNLSHNIPRFTHNNKYMQGHINRHYIPPSDGIADG